jgi:DNA polymerase III alpha subunit
LAAITVYLKFKHPKQFFLSLLKMSRFEPDSIAEVAKIQREFKSFNMKLLPPHLIKSANDFCVEGDDIRFGLLSIKGISDKSIEKVNQFRSPKSNKFEVFQSAEEANLQIGILSALIQAGALDGFKQSRSRVVLEAQLWNILTDNEKKYALQFAEQFDYDLCAIIKHLETFTNEKGKVIIKPSRLETIRKKYEPYKAIYYLNSKNEAFANWFYENRLIGYSSEHKLRDIFAEKSPNLISIAEAKKVEKDDDVLFIGKVIEAKESVSKKKTPMFRMIIGDEEETMTVLMFNTEGRNGKNFRIDECRNLNGGNLPKEDNIVIVRGQFKGDAVFANLAAVQDQKIYVRLGELKSIKKKESENSEKVVEQPANVLQT